MFRDDLQNQTWARYGQDVQSKIKNLCQLIPKL